MVQDLQDLFKMLNLAYDIRIPDSPLGSFCIGKVHINILSILSIKANLSPQDLRWPVSLTRVWTFFGPFIQDAKPDRAKNRTGQAVVQSKAHFSR